MFSGGVEGEQCSDLKWIHNSPIHPFVPNAPFLYPLKISENLTIMWFDLQASQMNQKQLFLTLSSFYSRRLFFLQEKLITVYFLHTTMRYLKKCSEVSRILGICVH